MANEVRGEFTIELDGAPHNMRPSWEAVLEYETATDKDTITLARAAVAGALKTREMGAIAAACIRAFGKAENDRSHAGVSDAAVTRCIVEIGAIAALKAIQPMLVMAATGGVTSEGKAKAPPTPALTEPSKQPEGDSAI